MCNELDHGDGRYCVSDYIDEDYMRFGRRQVEVEFEEDYRIYVPETSECIITELYSVAEMYRELALKHSWMGMMLDPELEWANHMRGGDLDDECQAMFCTEFHNLNETRCSEDINWVSLKEDFESNRIG